ncbi:glycosyltransferase family protein [Mucilaginibacter conchicola]|nr:hypothetical protein [Mucilaginibacter conchicola]
MKKQKLDILRFFLSLSDILLLNMCLFVGTYLSNKYGNQYNENIYLHSVLPLNAIWVLVTNLFRVYNEYTVYKLADIKRATWRSILALCLFFELYTKITVPYSYPTQFTYFVLGLVVLMFALSRYLYSTIEKLMQIDPAERSATVLAIASIGGHWVELQRLSPLFKEHDVTYISNTRNMDTKVKGSKHYYVPDANKDRKLDLIKCFFAVLRRVILLKPRVVITTGAAPGLMGIVVGKILGAKTIWIDSIANVEKLSLSGRIALKVADRVYTQWEHLSNDKIVYSGNLL